MLGFGVFVWSGCDVRDFFKRGGDTVGPLVLAFPDCHPSALCWFVWFIYCMYSSCGEVLGLLMGEGGVGLGAVALLVEGCGDCCGVSCLFFCCGGALEVFLHGGGGHTWFSMRSGGLFIVPE